MALVDSDDAADGPAAVQPPPISRHKVTAQPAETVAPIVALCSSGIEDLTMSMRQAGIGRQVFGTAVLGSGVVNVVWHHGPVYLYIVAAAQIIGGLALVFRPTARAGAAITGAAYLALALLCIPQIAAHPRVYAVWGNFFYPFANLIGAATAYALLASTPLSKIHLRIGCILFGVCSISFAIEQVEFLGRTESLVPMWIPPSQFFWAITTTAPFALAGVALIIDRMASLATRLLAAMLWAFGLLVWVPLILQNPHSGSNWSEGTETVAIGGAAWILSVLIARNVGTTAEDFIINRVPR